jgi:arabinan endo-1,5-alpha-L-arabinosidase
LFAELRLLTVLVLAVVMTGSSAVEGSAVAPVHDPAVIRQGVYYYLFSTGRGIPIRRSTDLVNWQRTGRVFENDVPEWVKEAIPEARGLWAPDVSLSKGLYRIYYSVSTFGSQRSAIGLVVNKTLDAADPNYRWEDRGMVIDSAPGRTDFNAIDADAFTDEDGQAWLVFGSFWGGIKMVRLNPDSGMPADPNIMGIAARPGETAIEGACLMRHDGYYYLFASFDLCCKGVDSTYKIMIGRSKGVTGPYVDKNGKDMREGGGSLVLAGDDDWKGPGHSEILQDGGKDYLVHHAYDAHNNGRATLLIRPLTWDAGGWPIAGKPLRP